MNVSTDVLRTHVDYTNWATNRLLGQAAQLSSDELTQDFGTADRSVLQTLAHVYAADQIWLARVQGQAFQMLKPAGITLEFLQSEWPDLQTRWNTYASAITDPDQLITYSPLNGQQYTQPLWQL